MPDIYVRADTGNDSNPGTEASPKRTFANGLAALKAASGAGDKTLWLYQDVNDSLAYNIAATQSLTDADDVPGAAFAFKKYGPGEHAWLEATTRVTGWVDDGPGRARATVSGSFRTVWWGANRRRLKWATRGEEQTDANRTTYRVQRWHEGHVFASGGSFTSATSRNCILANYTLSFTGTGSVTVSGTMYGGANPAPPPFVGAGGGGQSIHLLFVPNNGAVTFTPSGTVTGCTLQPFYGIYLAGAGAFTSPQSQQVSAGTYLLRFFGAGTVVASGAATGTFNGTGAGLSTHTITVASAGVLTLSPSGTVNSASLQNTADVRAPGDVWTLDVPTSTVPSASAISAGVWICVQMGWSLSKMRVASVSNLGNGNTRIYPAAPEREVEFAKGDLAFPGLGRGFALGPYHQDPFEFPLLENGTPNLGQRFWWEGAAEFLDGPGEWYHNPGTNTLTVQLPAGIANAAALDAAGVYVTNGVERLISLNGSAATSRVTGVKFQSIGFRAVDWTWPNSNGAIGYLGRGTLLRNDSGALGFQEIEPAVYQIATDAVGFEDCVFRDLGGGGIQPIVWNSNLAVKGCLFTRLSGAGIAGGGTLGVQFNLPESQWSRNIFVYDSIFKDCGEGYPTAGASMGAMRDFYMLRTTIDGTTSNGLDFDTGGEWYGTWEQDGLVAGCDIKRFMKWTQDTGGVYKSGNMAGAVSTALAPADPSFTKGVKIVANWIGDSVVHDNDPFGGKQPAVYFDLGQQLGLVSGNRIYNCPLAFKENCVGYNLFANNQVTGCSELRRAFYSGFNVWTVNGPMAATGLNVFAIPYTLSFVGKATNEIRASDTMATQTRTLPAELHTLSFEGTGSIALSGGFSGTISGLGANTRVQLSFTPTTTPVVLTVTGSVRFAQLELGGAFTEYVPNTSTTSAAVGSEIVVSGPHSLTVRGRGLATRISVTFTPSPPPVPGFAFMSLTPTGDVRDARLEATGVRFEMGSFILYEPPLSNPPTATDIQKFYGTGPYTGRGFQSILSAFATPEQVITNGQYNSTSRFIDNNALQKAPPASEVGAFPETFARFADQLG